MIRFIDSDQRLLSFTLLFLNKTLLFLNFDLELLFLFVLFLLLLDLVEHKFNLFC
jgi:NADH:ubiquinone oxidoreductase subunit 3 (subunit A)